MKSSDVVISPLAKPAVQLAVGAVGAAIALPFLWFSGIFSTYFGLFKYGTPVVILAALFIPGSRWYAFGALAALMAVIAYLWATAGSTVPALPADPG